MVNHKVLSLPIFIKNVVINLHNLIVDKEKV